MGELDRYGEYRKPRRGLLLGQDDNALVILFAINVFFYLILIFISVGYAFGGRADGSFQAEVLTWFALPSSFTKFSEKPWTLLVYVVSEEGRGIIRLITNMIWLWAFGYLLQNMAGNDKLIPVYIYGGLVGGLIFMVAHHLLPQAQALRGTTALLGANNGVLAVAMATTTLSPNYRFFQQIRNGVPIWVLMGIYILVDFAGVAENDAAYSLSHLSAVATGFVFVLLLKHGVDMSAWMNKLYSGIIHLFKPATSPTQEKIKKMVFYNTDGRKPFEKTSNVTQQRVDEILDKISQKGFHFLTEEEKNILKKAAEDDEL